MDHPAKRRRPRPPATISTSPAIASVSGQVLRTARGIRAHVARLGCAYARRSPLHRAYRAAQVDEGVAAPLSEIGISPTPKAYSMPN